MSEIELTIESVGVHGDGVAHVNGKPLYVPFSAPGDRLKARVTKDRGEIVEVLSPGQRAQPPCRHFGDCGGCSLQHLSSAAYAAAKTGWLAGALASHGFRDPPIAKLVRLAPGTRRRARLALKRGQSASAGFHARMSHRVVDMRECLVLHPDLVALVEPLRRLASDILPPGGEGHASMTRTDGGVALLLDLPEAPGLAALETLARFAAAQNLARLSWRADGTVAPVTQRRPARIALAGVAVDLPEEAFLQASEEADRVLAGAVREAVGGAKRIADLYAGLGTFSFALAPAASVHAVEGDAPSLKALEAAAGRAQLSQVSAEQRDLARRPLSAEELSRFDAVVFDPPRAGAADQSRALAASKVPVVVAVSCSPASFARDARTLADDGYALERVQPFDTFVWSANLEIVARFVRR